MPLFHVYRTTSFVLPCIVPLCIITAACSGTPIHNDSYLLSASTHPCILSLFYTHNLLQSVLIFPCFLSPLHAYYHKHHFFLSPLHAYYIWFHIPISLVCRLSICIADYVLMSHGPHALMFMLDELLPYTLMIMSWWATAMYIHDTVWVCYYPYVLRIIFWWVTFHIHWRLLSYTSSCTSLWLHVWIVLAS